MDRMQMPGKKLVTFLPVLLVLLTIATYYFAQKMTFPFEYVISPLLLIVAFWFSLSSAEKKTLEANSPAQVENLLHTVSALGRFIPLDCTKEEKKIASLQGKNVLQQITMILVIKNDHQLSHWNSNKLKICNSAKMKSTIEEFCNQKSCFLVFFLETPQQNFYNLVDFVAQYKCSKFLVPEHTAKELTQKEKIVSIPEQDYQETLTMIHQLFEDKIGVDKKRTKKQGISLLLVEDNIDNQHLASILLQKQGYTVTIAHNGKQALDLLERESFDLILMDVQMPVMSGFEATKAIREKEKGTDEHVPIVALTALAMKGDKERCLEVGMNDYVTKPIITSELYNAIERTLFSENTDQDVVENDNPGIMVFDYERALENTDGDRELFAELVQLFINSSEERMTKMDKALKEKDKKQLELLAHSLKGSIGIFSAQKTFDLAYNLEMTANEGNFEHSLKLYNSLQKEISLLKDQLNKVIEV